MGVTLKTFLVDGLSINEIVSYGAMRIMTVGAIHFAFPNGMVGLSQHLGSNVFMALSACLGLVFQGKIVGIVIVDVMATRAG